MADAVAGPKRLELGDKRRCRLCGLTIIGAEDDCGRIVPVEYAPDAEGDVLVFKAGPRSLRWGKWQARTFTGAGLRALQDQGVPLRLNHLTSCTGLETHI